MACIEALLHRGIANSLVSTREKAMDHLWNQYHLQNINTCGKIVCIDWVFDLKD